MPRLGPTLAALLAALALPAPAQDAGMTDAQLDALLTGNTLYIEVPPGPAGGPEGGVAPFKYGADGSARARLPAGATLTGRWSISDGRYCVDWDDGPKNSCTVLRRGAGTLELVDAAGGAVRGTVARIVPGNPENL